MKKVLSIASALVIAGIAFGGIASARTTSARVIHNSGCTASGNISYMFWGDQGEDIEQTAAIKRVEQICPHIHVHALYTPNNYDNTLAQDIGTGNAPDVFQLDAGKRIPEFVSADHALTNLSPYAAKDHFNPSKVYWPECLAQGYYHHQLYGLMRDCSNQAMIVYNADMFKARHVALPKNNWTLSTFANDAKKLSGIYSLPTDKSKSPRFGIGIENDDFRVNAYMFAFGGNWLTSNDKCGFTSSGSEAGLTWWHNLMYKVHGAPTWAQQQLSGWDAYDAFHSQKEAMYEAGAWALDYLVKPSPYTGQKPVPFHWGVVLPPKGPKGQDGLIDSAVEGVYSHSKHKQAAFEFIRYLTTSAPAALEAYYGIGLPGDKKLSESSDAKKEYGSTLNEWLLGNKYAQPERSLPTYDHYINDTLGPSSSPIWQYWASPSESAKTAAKAACAAATKAGDFK
jgi:multiple sugar transport system substrate-binding protein